ncbi:hypothetical protein AMTRI_Chr07g75410 [Amborella trichopoda]
MSNLEPAFMPCVCWSHGLVCLLKTIPYSSQIFQIRNSAILTSKYVSVLEYEWPWKVYTMGFSFNPKSGNFKILAYGLFRGLKKTEEWHLYSSESGNWRSFLGPSSGDFVFKYSRPLVCVGNAFYFLSHDSRRVWFFNLEGETFESISTPDEFPTNEFPNKYKVELMRGDQVLMAHINEGFQLSIWSLTEKSKWVLKVEVNLRRVESEFHAVQAYPQLRLGTLSGLRATIAICLSIMSRVRSLSGLKMIMVVILTMCSLFEPLTVCSLFDPHSSQ